MITAKDIDENGNLIAKNLENSEEEDSCEDEEDEDENQMQKED